MTGTLSANRPSLSRRAVLGGTAGLLLAQATASPALAQFEPLPSWSENTRARITAFVARVTTPGVADFVPPAERIAVFDNDGTLWSEQPIYAQLAFALDQIKSLAARDPALAGAEPFASVLSGDPARIAAFSEKDLFQIVARSHAGQTSAAFEAEVKAWLATARHPRFGRRYDELVFQPMLELLAYLRGNGFKTYIVSGGGVEFMRAWAEQAYGIPPEQIVGSSLKSVFRLDGDSAQIDKLPEVEFIDDGPGKPVAIQRFIGRRPIFAAGNSDGDLEMLQFTTLAPGVRFGLIVRHTDAEREWAYDRTSPVGRLDRALDEAGRRDWLVVDMKRDWTRIYSF